MLLVVSLAGCYAPIHSPGIPASALPDFYRLPIRTCGEPLNFSKLVVPPPTQYLLGPGDLLDVTIPDLLHRGDARPFQVQVLDNGEIQLPRLGPINVGGRSLADAQRMISALLANRFLRYPSVTLTLLQKGTVNVLVLGAVQTPGIHTLPRYENDVGHALAAAGGFIEVAGDSIEIHRQGHLLPPGPLPSVNSQTTPIGIPNYLWQSSPQSFPIPPNSMPGQYPPHPGPLTQPNSPPITIPDGFAHQPEVLLVGHSESVDSEQPQPETWDAVPPIPTVPNPIVRIPLRGADPYSLHPQNMVLNPGDVVVVPNRKQEVFYVVGRLSETNRVRFTVGDRDREIGNGLLLPPDREIDVVTAVAMAGYIDPIDSPTTVTVHRVQPDGTPLLINVDLIRARSDPRETILIQPNDLVYLNPDCWWYSRHLFERIIDRGLGSAVGDWLTR